MGRQDDLAGAPALLERLPGEAERLRQAYAEMDSQGK
jgi:hypothetical protein